MWLYLGPSCPDRPSSEELSTAEVDSQIHKVLDLGANLNPRVSPVPLQEGIVGSRVSTLGPILAAYEILSFHCAHSLAQGLGGGCSKLQEVDSPEDAARQEASHVFNEKVWAQRENKPGAPPDERRKGRGCTPHRSAPSSEGEEVGEITLPPLSSMCITPPPFPDIV
jgi:hypothetical protein